MVDKAASDSLTPRSTVDFQQIDTWVFDLDNTRYSVTETLLRHIDEHMGKFVANFLTPWT
jgi:hypothetical protein